MKQGMNYSFKNKNIYVMSLQKIIPLLLLALFAFAPLAYGQQEAELEAPNTLEEQFRSMKNVSNTYQDYKVVRETLLNQFYNNVRDSINDYQQEIAEAQQRIEAQQQEINRLQNELQEREEAVAEAQHGIEHIQVLGINIRKDTYNFIVWGIILVLLIVLAVAILKYKSSNKVAVKKRNEYDNLDQEFNEFKLRSREKETRLMRELQTERNTVEDLNQRLATAQKSK